MALAVRLHTQGGPEVMALEEVAVPPPGSSEATVRHAAIGLNFIDVYQRNGHYKVQLPSGLGQEAAGGVALILCQWLRELGATVLGTVGTEAKAALARSAGCAHPFVLNDHTRGNLVEQVRSLTSGAMVPVADSIGRETLTMLVPGSAGDGVILGLTATGREVGPLGIPALTAGGSCTSPDPPRARPCSRSATTSTGRSGAFETHRPRGDQIRSQPAPPPREVARAHRDLGTGKATSPRCSFRLRRSRRA